MGAALAYVKRQPFAHNNVAGWPTPVTYRPPTKGIEYDEFVGELRPPTDRAFTELHVRYGVRNKPLLRLVDHRARAATTTPMPAGQLARCGAPAIPGIWHGAAGVASRSTRRSPGRTAVFATEGRCRCTNACNAKCQAQSSADSCTPGLRSVRSNERDWVSRLFDVMR